MPPIAGTTTVTTTNIHDWMAQYVNTAYGGTIFHQATIKKAEEVKKETLPFIMSVRGALEEFELKYTPNKWLPPFCFKNGRVIKQGANAHAPMDLPQNPPRVSIMGFFHLLKGRLTDRTFGMVAQDYLLRAMVKLYPVPLDLYNMNPVDYDLETFQARILPAGGMPTLIKLVGVAKEMEARDQEKKALAKKAKVDAQNAATRGAGMWGVEENLIPRMPREPEPAWDDDDDTF